VGFTGVLIDEAYGGSGLGVVEAGIIAEAIGATLAPLPFLSTSVLGASLLGLFGSDTQRSALLPEMASGRHLTALALDEGANTGQIASPCWRDAMATGTCSTAARCSSSTAMWPTR
jgi:alkylation response protein AidB-like acyl-CoA dehydrogenase